MNYHTKIRRTALLCTHMTRNLAYYHTGMKYLNKNGSSDFWRTLIGNCMDTAVLEWCKLFGDKKAQQSIYKILEDPQKYLRLMFNEIGITQEEYKACQIELRRYRDKFVAHLDSEETMDVPNMDKPHRMIDHLFMYLKLNYVGSIFIDLPKDMSAYWCSSNEEAQSIFNLTN